MTKGTLKNGAAILSLHEDTALCLFNGEFVTWKVNGEGEAYWGHYFKKNEQAALESFKERAGVEHVEL